MHTQPFRLLLVLALVSGSVGWSIEARESRSSAGAGSQTRARAFFMGFTPVDYAAFGEITPSLDETYRFIADNGDLIAQHFDEGVPWPEALDRKAYHPNVEKNLAHRVKQHRPTQKTYVAVTPLSDQRDGLAGYWGADGNQERPGKWRSKRLDDSEIIAAYTNFCRDMIRRFQPDFFAYGIEVNFLVKNNRAWDEYVRFLKPVYTTLKREHPDLPLFVSLQIDEVWRDFDRQAAAIRQILPYTDYVAISSYPYLDHPNPSSLPEDFISRVAKLAPNKPFAVAETGFIAEELDFSTGARIPGNEEWQAQWVARVLEQAEALDAEFVVWFVPRDYDIFFRNLVEFVKINTAAAPLVDVFRTFRDTGLLDGAGRPRPAYELWNEVRRRPRR